MKTMSHEYHFSQNGQKGPDAIVVGEIEQNVAETCDIREDEQ